jgi:hypothetical protein
MHTPAPGTSRTPSYAPSCSPPSKVQGLKAFACAVVALAVTAAFSWSFVHTTSIERVSAELTGLSVAAAVTPFGR